MGAEDNQQEAGSAPTCSSTHAHPQDPTLDRCTVLLPLLPLASWGRGAVRGVSSPVAQPRSQGHSRGGRRCQTSKLLLSPLPLPTCLVTYMRGGGLGGSGSLEHGSSEVLGGPGGDAEPRGFCKGKSVSRAP